MKRASRSTRSRSFALAVLPAVLPAVLLAAGIAAAQNPAPAPAAKEGTLDVVATAHLDTQWRWTIQNTVNEYIPATFRDNVALMDRYPGYVFSFEGAFRYMLLREYYPADYRRLGDYIRQGRWRVAGSWVDAVDVNLPAFESLVRQTLYGNGYFRREFGRGSRDIFLPDCFGFGYALPSIAAHCGLKSFSTQKLAWGSAYGVPFDIGRWEGVDGSSIVAALHPGDYVTQIKDDLSRDSTWVARVEHQAATSGLRGAYMYFGTGDTGGAPDSASVGWLAKSLASDGPLHVRSAGSDELVDLTAGLADSELPHYKGELVMTRHGVGCYTSEAAMKRWNRRNEELAGAAEGAAVVADLLGGTRYPRTALADTWVRFLWHQFHDDLTGTSIPEAYEFSWNDELLCQNRFSGLLETAVAATTPALDTRARGIPLVVYNPLGFERQDVVEATVTTGSRRPGGIRVVDPEGRETPSQVVEAWPDSLRVLFLARVPAVGYAVYDLRAEKPRGPKPELRVTARSLENRRYRVSLNDDGDVSSIYDKSAGRELLAKPIQWELLHDKPHQWPAWEIQYEDATAPPRAAVTGPATIRVTEEGPARAAIEVARTSGQSTFRTTIRLASGDAGNRVEFASDVDWFERETLLKAAFHVTSPADEATYDLGLGAIARGLDHKELYEVPGHEWADLTAAAGDYGVAVLNDCKYGWDHPDSSTLRLSLLHTPGIAENWSWVGDQASQDLGHHRFTFGVTGHRGDWRDGAVVSEAARMNQPLMVFQVPAHAGKLGRSLSLVSLTAVPPAPKGSHPPTRGNALVNAVKLAENSDEIVVRVRETSGRPLDRAELRFLRPVAAVREVNGAEDAMPPGAKPPRVQQGRVVFYLAPYQPRAFAVTLASGGARPLHPPASAPIALPYDLDGMSTDDNRRDGDFDGQGNSIAGELFPDTLVERGLTFTRGPLGPGAANVTSGRGQTLAIPAGYDHVALLAAATGGPALGIFTVGARPESVWIQDWSEPVGQWWDRLSGGRLVKEDAAIAPAYINHAPIGWYGTHRHTAAGENEAYRFTYAQLVNLRLPPGARAITLPGNERVKILAASAARGCGDDIRAAAPLYDEASATVARVQAAHRNFIDSTVVGLSTPVPGAELHYTTDGTDPGRDSPRYASPLVLRATTTVKARALKSGVDDHYVASIAVNRQAPRPPVTVAQTRPGLRCRYFEGSWSKAPGPDTLTAVRESVADTVGIPDYARHEEFALAFDGYVKIPLEGMYEFGVESDDGSVLSVADTLVADNDGLHGDEEVTGEIALKPGLHKFRVLMFQEKGDDALRVTVSGPGMAKKTLAAGWLVSDAITPAKGRPQMR